MRDFDRYSILLSMHLKITELVIFKNYVLYVYSVNVIPWVERENPVAVLRVHVDPLSDELRIVPL